MKIWTEEEQTKNFTEDNYDLITQFMELYVQSISFFNSFKSNKPLRIISVVSENERSYCVSRYLLI